MNKNEMGRVGEKSPGGQQESRPAKLQGFEALGGIPQLHSGQSQRLQIGLGDQN